jgi:hypothetical protein
VIETVKAKFDLKQSVPDLLSASSLCPAYSTVHRQGFLSVCLQAFLERQRGSRRNANVPCNEMDADIARVRFTTRTGSTHQSKKTFMQGLPETCTQISVTNGSRHAYRNPWGRRYRGRYTTRKAKQFSEPTTQPARVAGLPLEVSGKRPNKTSFTEKTRTIVVNSLGALLNLKEPVVNGQVLTLKNDATKERINCSVVDIFSGQDGAPGVAVEFCEPCPRYWRVTFPPADWSLRSPGAKKYADPGKPPAGNP